MCPPLASCDLLNERGRYVELPTDFGKRPSCFAQSEYVWDIAIREPGRGVKFALWHSAPVAVLSYGVLSPRHPREVRGDIVGPLSVKVIDCRAREMTRHERQRHQSVNIEAPFPAVSSDGHSRISAAPMRVRLEHLPSAELRRLQRSPRRREVIQRSHTAQIGHLKVGFEPWRRTPNLGSGQDSFRDSIGVTGVSHSALQSRGGQGRDGDLQAPFRPVIYGRFLPFSQRKTA